MLPERTRAIIAPPPCGGLPRELRPSSLVPMDWWRLSGDRANDVDAFDELGCRLPRSRVRDDRRLEVRSWRMRV